MLILAAASAQQAPIAGDWSGVIEAPGAQLKVVLHVKAEAGKLSATLDSLTQGAMGLPIDEIVLENGVLRFQMSRLGASFEGTLAADGSSIEGKFAQSGLAMPMKLTRGGVQALLRPQEPKPPFPYRAEDVTFENKDGGFSLAGTLTLPQGKGPFPAAILITGSGPQDRDESIMGHKPFAVLADHLTRNGVAVLRYDDRGFGKSGGKFLPATTKDFASDAWAAFEYLRSRPEIAAARIGLIGHSEGGLVAPMVASEKPGVAFVVLLAGPGVTGEQVMLAQGPAVMRAMGAPPAAVEANSAMQQKIFAALREDPEPLTASKKLSEILPPGPQSDAQIRQLTGPWMQFFRTYDPVPALRKVKCPVLVMNGELDLQVLPDQNLPPIEAALKAGGNADFRIERLKGLNHLFQTARTGAPAEYAQIEETMSPAALQLISGWVRSKTGLAR